MNVLILLLGGNPLPNYVVVRYLLMDADERKDTQEIPVPDKIIFIYSNRTENLFRNIKNNKELNIKPDQYCYINLGDQQRKPYVIQEKLLNKLRELDQNEENPVKSVHLNYTGGTKPMTVNSFIAVNEFLRKSETKLILSDLDPDHFKIVLIKPNSKNSSTSEYPLKGDLRNMVKLNTRDIFYLHDMKTRKEGTKTFIFGEDKVDLNQFVEEAVKEYINFNPCKNKEKKERIVFSKFSSKFTLPRLRSSEKKEEKLKKQGIFKESFKEIREKFPSISKLFDANDQLIPPAVPFVEFFTGKWLEDYVLKTLINLQEKKEIDVDHISKGVEATYGNRETEIDIIVIKGYQLLLISCTTSREIQYVKQKAFEALYRAVQLGGEHAKVIVVSPMYNNRTEEDHFSIDHNLKRLRNDLEQFDARENCYLLGIDQLSMPENDDNHLGSRLRNIIQGGE